MKGCPRVSKASTSGREASAMIVARGGCGGVLWLRTAAATSARGEPESLESAHNRSGVLVCRAPCAGVPGAWERARAEHHALPKWDGQTNFVNQKYYLLMIRALT